MPRFTLGELRDQVYSRLENNDQMFQPSEVTDAINEGVSCVNLICGWYQGTRSVSTVTTIAGRHIYDVPEDIVFPQRVTFEGQVLERSGLMTLASTWPRFLQDTTSNTGKQVSRWSPIGIRKFVIHPGDSVGGGALEVTGILNPDVLEESSDQVYIPKEGLTAVCDYAAHAVQCKLQGTPFMQSLTMFRNYEALVGLQKYWANYKQPNLFFDERNAIKT